MKTICTMFLIAVAAFGQEWHPCGRHAMCASFYFAEPISLSISSSDVELTQEEQWATIVGLHAMEPVLFDKAPMSLDLESVDSTAPGRDMWIVDADDGRPSGPISPLGFAQAHTAAWTPPSAPNQCQGVCASFSGQGAAALKALTGKRIVGVQLIAVEICSTHPATFGAGLILQYASALGIQYHSPKIGSAIVQHTTDLNWRNVIINTAKVGTMLAAALTVSGTIAASAAWQTGLVVGHAATDSLPMLFSPGAPNPDPYLSGVLDANGTITVTPDRCVEATFSGVFGKNSVVLSGPIPILP